MEFYYEYLYKMGEALDCYATIERLADTQAHDSPLSADTEVVDDDVETIGELVDKLNNELQGVTVIRSTVNPDVIHLIETALIQTGYVMDEEVTLTYNGTLHGLVVELGQQLSGIGPRKGAAYPFAGEDYSTQTTVDVTDEVVRDMLMEAVPLEGYGRILFEAVTHEQNSTQHTMVSYLGPPLSE